MDMDTNWTLFWIGIAMFILGAAVRLYFGMKTRQTRKDTPEWISTTQGKRFKTIYYICAGCSWIGITLSIFAI